MEWYLDISLGPVENPHKGATKDSSVEPLVIDSDHLHSLGALLVHGPSVGRNNLYPRLIPVQTSSGGISSISTVVITSLRKDCFSCLKFSTECLLLAVVTFLFTNFMRCKREYSTPSAGSLQYAPQIQPALTAPPTLGGTSNCPHCFCSPVRPLDL